MTINFSSQPPSELKSLNEKVTSASSKMAQCNGAKSIPDKQRFFLQKIQHYESKYISVKHKTNVEHKYIFGMVLLELYTYFRKTDENSKKKFGKELQGSYSLATLV